MRKRIRNNRYQILFHSSSGNTEVKLRVVFVNYSARSSILGLNPNFF